MRNRMTIAMSLFCLMMISFVPALHAGWTLNGAPVCTNSGVQQNPQILPDGQGGAFIVWDDSRTLTDVYAQRLDEMGRPQWAEDGIVIAHEFMSQTRVKITTDGAGGFIAVWEDSREEDQWDIYAQRVDANGNLLWTNGGAAVCTNTEDQFYPEICSDGSNGCIITWVDRRTTEGDDDIYAQRISSEGTPLWTNNGIVVCSADSLQTEAKIVSDGSGGAVIVWADYRAGLDIYAQRLDPSGTALWAADGAPVVNIPGESHYQHDIDTDGAGGAFVTWCDRQGTSLDVYLQRIDSSGNRVFASTGITLCNASGTQREPVVVYDGNGGAIAAWVDFRNGSTNSDVYATRVDAGGIMLWTETNGVPVCNSPDQVYYLTALCDTEGGGIFAWSDLRDFTVSGYDVYAQRVDADGQLMWAIDGDSICKAPGPQAQMVMATDGSGGAIIAWRDARVMDNDIYAQRITAGGDLVGTTLSSFSCFCPGNIVELSWTVSEPMTTADFKVFRSRCRSGETGELSIAVYSADGLDFSCEDCSVEPGESYSYRVEMSEEDGGRTLFETGPVTVPAASLRLYQNSPNPFNPSTRIAWDLDERCRVRIEIFDAAGRKVRTLADTFMGPGRHEAVWDGRASGGNPAGSGVYMCRLTAGKRALSRKMILLR